MSKFNIGMELLGQIKSTLNRHGSGWSRQVVEFVQFGEKLLLEQRAAEEGFEAERED